jgi:hypothetical protein
VRGVQGILDVYKMSFQSGITLYGPTNFAQVRPKSSPVSLVTGTDDHIQIIRNAADRGRAMNANIQDVQSYLILLVRT